MKPYQSISSSNIIKTTTIAALFVAFVLLVGVTGSTSPVYAGIGTSPGPMDFWMMFFGLGFIDFDRGEYVVSPRDTTSDVIQGSAWGW